MKVEMFELPQCVDHSLKCWPEPFKAVRAKMKTFEIRNNDRCFQKGQTLMLLEFVPNATDPSIGCYTGEYEGPFEITFVLSGWGLAPNHVCLQLAPLCVLEAPGGIRTTNTIGKRLL